VEIFEKKSMSNEKDNTRYFALGFAIILVVGLVILSLQLMGVIG
jgi:hypothetical protein